MRFLAYLRRHKKSDDSLYVMGGLSGALVALIVFVFAIAVAAHFALRSSSLASVISGVLVDLANSDRSAFSVGTLTVNPLLTAAAQAKANDMAAKGYFAHVSPDGKDSWYWFQQAGYSFSYAGENLAVDFSDSDNVEQAWMNSPTHRANILDGHFSEVGIATAQGAYDGHPTTFVVEMFGTPAVSSKFADIQTVSSPENPTQPALATIAPAPSAPKAETTTPATNTPVLGATTEAVPLPGAPAPQPPSWWSYLLASPQTVLEYAYYSIAVLVLAFLVLVTEMEFKRHHLRHVAAAGALLLLMVGLFALANYAFFSTPVLAAPSFAEPG